MYPQLENDVGSMIRQQVFAIPMCTCGVMMLCISVEVLSWLVPAVEAEGMLCPGNVLYKFQVYRLLTAAFLHSGLIHLIMNMFALASIGSTVETKLGTVVMTGLVLGLAVSAHLLYVAVLWLVSVLSGSWAPIYSCALGFSGVLFGLMAVDSALRDNSPRRVFFFAVPAACYPWVMLLLVSFLMPGASFLGHLCGLTMGCFYVKGWLNKFTPSRSRLLTWERNLPVYSHPQFFRLPEVSPLRIPVADWAPESFWQRLEAAIPRPGGSPYSYQAVPQNNDHMFIGQGYTLGSMAHSSLASKPTDSVFTVPGPASAVLETWACPRCTFINPAAATVCKMCGFSNGSSVAISVVPSAPVAPPIPSAPEQYLLSPPSAPPEVQNEPTQPPPSNGKTNVANVSRLLQPQ